MKNYTNIACIDKSYECKYRFKLTWLRKKLEFLLEFIKKLYLMLLF